MRNQVGCGNQALERGFECFCLEALPLFGRNSFLALLHFENRAHRRRM